MDQRDGLHQLLTSITGTSDDLRASSPRTARTSSRSRRRAARRWPRWPATRPSSRACSASSSTPSRASTPSSARGRTSRASTFTAEIATNRGKYVPGEEPRYLDNRGPRCYPTLPLGPQYPPDGPFRDGAQATPAPVGQPGPELTSYGMINSSYDMGVAQLAGGAAGDVRAGGGRCRDGTDPERRPRVELVLVGPLYAARRWQVSRWRPSRVSAAWSSSSPVRRSSSSFWRRRCSELTIANSARAARAPEPTAPTGSPTRRGSCPATTSGSRAWSSGASTRSRSWTGDWPRSTSRSTPPSRSRRPRRRRSSTRTSSAALPGVGQGAGATGAMLKAGDTIPVAHTRPPLNLTTLFNGFSRCSPRSTRSRSTRCRWRSCRCLRARAAPWRALLASTSSLTSAIADRDEVIGRVVDNLTRCCRRSTRATSSSRTSSARCGSSCRASRPTGSRSGAISSLGDLTQVTAGFLTDARPGLRRDIASLRDLSTQLDAGGPTIERFLRTAPGKLNTISRAASYGSWFQFYTVRGQRQDRHRGSRSGTEIPAFHSDSPRCGPDPRGAGGQSPSRCSRTRRTCPS